MLRVLVFGRTGQVARELDRAAAAEGIALRALDRAAADLADPESCRRAVAAAAADVDAVINAAAYTAVDRAETDEAMAQAVNARGPGAIARACAEAGLPFLHISTDYVFDGRPPGRPWREEDAPAPLGAYGRSKLAGERAVAEAGGVSAILRTGWVFSAHGSNFVRTMLRLGAERDRLRIVEDQVGGPTPARAIAGALLVMAAALAAGRGATGLFHFGGTPPVSWADFAQAIFARRAAMRGLPAPAIERIPSSAYPVPAARPADSVLDCTRIRAAYGIEQPDWRGHLDQVLEELS